MFAFLMKKISIPSQTTVQSVAWSHSEGWIAIGGTNGLLKIIKLEDPRDQQSKGITNITLELHKGNVTLLCWNDKYKKLTSADSNGLIIVWMLHNNKWFQQMINNRSKSVVADMKWSPDGACICIIYQDGAVIMGSIDGNRLWGKQYKHNLKFLEWSPDSKMLLLGTEQGQIFVYDHNGQYLKQIKMLGLQKIVQTNKYLTPNLPLACIQWYEEAKMFAQDNPLGLCVSYQLGRIILMKNDRDDDPLAIDCSMKISKIKWNPSGTIFAVAGSFQQFQENKGVIKFFDGQGNHLKNLKLPNAEDVKTLSWQGNGLRMSIGCGAAIYIASIKPNYKWTHLSNEVLVFAYQKSDRVDFCIVFWNIKTKSRVIKYVKNLCQLRGQGQYCSLFYKGEQVQGSGTCIKIQLCNSIGTCLQTKYVNLDPINYTMSKTHIIICSQNYVYLWHYKNISSKITSFDSMNHLGLKKIGRQICFFIGDIPDTNKIYDKDVFDNTKEAQDIIFACAANQNILLLGRESGVINKYSLPHITQEPKLFWKSLPMTIQINSDSTRVGLTDISGTLNIMEINSQGGNVLQFQKKDCWSIKWSLDHPLQFAYMQKAKLATVYNVTGDPHIVTDSYICEFSKLRVKCIYLDDVIKSADGNLLEQDIFFDHQSQLLKQFLQIYERDGINAICKFAQQNQHQHFWAIIAEKSLENLDFKNAQRALLKTNDYKGLKLIKKIQSLDDKQKQRAEVLAYYGKYDQAQQIYRSMQRKDLAIQMRFRIGDWFKVSQMIKQGSGYDDTLIKVYDNLGQQHAQKMQWVKAAQYFLLAKNYKELIQTFIKLQDYQSLAQVIQQLPQNDSLLMELAERFKLAGLAQYAVKCYERCGEIKTAIDCCVLLNQWNIAVQLAQKHNLVQIEGLLQQYANQLLQQNKRLQAAQLYRKANHNTQAAKILSHIANDLIQRQQTPLVIKKLYVMAALQVDLYKKRLLDATMTGQTTNTTKTLDSLITSDINTSSEKILNNPWRGAQAWHFFILAQKQLYSRKYRQALKTSIRLSEYQLELDAKKIYSIIGLAAFHNKFYRQCSRAFFKLEGLPGLSYQEKQKYQQIAVSIFIKHPPKDGNSDRFPCPGKHCKAFVNQYETNCRSCGSNFQPCVLTGRSLLTKQYYTCKTCRHKMIEVQMQKAQQKFCALCHSQVDYKRFGLHNDQIIQ